MRPVLQKSGPNYKMIALYIVIAIVCILGIVLTIVNTKSIKTESAEVTKPDIEEYEYIKTKSDFENIINNQIENLQQDSINIKKINDKYDLVVTAFSYHESEGNCMINADIPYINISQMEVENINKHIYQNYKERAELLMKQSSDSNLTYTVKYQAYIQNNTVSLVIKSEFKEADGKQKTQIETFNYNFVDQRKVTIEEMLVAKNTDKLEATKKIRSEIQEIQEQIQSLNNTDGTNYQRDYTNSKYEIDNVTNFLYGKDGVLYIIFAYGNEEDTDEIDVVAFK